MTERSRDDEAAVRYLLGDAPEPEKEALEDSLFRDPEALDRIGAVEDELIDAYLSGELEPGERARFEKAYLSAPERRARVDFARALQERVRGRSGPATTGVYPVKRFPFRSLLAAAAVLLAILTAYFASDSIRARRELARLRTEQNSATKREQELARTLGETRETSEQRERDLAREREEKERIAQDLARLEKESARSISFTLSATLVRGGGSLQTLRLPHDVASVRLVAPLSQPSYAAYLASIRTPEGEIAWKGDAPRPEPGAQKLTVTVPARLLAPGDYILTVTGISESGHEEPVLDTAFRVKRP